MNLAIWMALPLLAGSPPVTAPVIGATAVAVDEYTELETSFDADLVKWKQAIKDGSREERKELRANHPVEQYWPRFEAKAKGGEGRALLWQASNVKNGPVERSDRGVFVYRCYAELAGKHAAAPWMGKAVQGIQGSGRMLTDDQKIELLDKIYGAEQGDKSVRANAGFWLSKLWLDSDDPTQVERGKALLASIPEEFPGTEAAMRAKAGGITAADLMPGKMAPDFQASTIEGHEFKLSDYRGKVVLIDFYGFW